MSASVHSHLGAPLVASVLAISPTVLGQCEYEVLLVPAPNQCFPSTDSPVSFRAINNHTEVAGNVYPCLGEPRAVYWSEATGIVYLNLGPQNRSQGYAINDAGAVVGTVSVPTPGDVVPAPFHYHAGEATILLPLPPLPPPYTAAPDQGEWLAINNDGLVGGFWGNGGQGPGMLPLTWAPESGPVELTGLFKSTRASIQHISDSGLLVGWTSLDGPKMYANRAFIGTVDGVTVLPAAPGGLESMFYSVNDQGIAVGCGTFPVPRTSMKRCKAFVWDGEFHDIGWVSDELPESVAWDINEIGQVVGTLFAGQAFLWINDQRYLLEDLVPDPAILHLSWAFGINDRGEIVAQVDMGTALKGAIIKPIRTRPGDATIDCHVDERDIQAIFTFWGRTYNYPQGPGDLNADGFVDAYDLALVLGDWGE